MCVSGPTIITKLPIEVNMKFGAYRELLSPLKVLSNTIQISYVPLGNENKDVSSRITPSVI